MASSMAPQPRAGEVRLPDIPRPKAARAGVQDRDTTWRKALGRAIARAFAMLGWSHKEAAAKIGVDPALVGKWTNGDPDRQPQFDRLFACEELREPLVVSLAGLTDDVTVKTTIEFRQRRTA